MSTAMELRMEAIVLAIFAAPFIYASLKFWLGWGNSTFGTDPRKANATYLIAAALVIMANTCGIFAAAVG